MNLTNLQKSTAEHIVHVFTRKENPVKRYLLADEVGLGKTVVAAKVIEELAKHKKGNQFIVYYVCGNLRITGQNMDSLKSNIQNAQETSTERLSMQIPPGNQNGIFIYSVTPATTFTNAGSHFNQEEAAYGKGFTHYQIRDKLLSELDTSKKYSLPMTKEKWIEIEEKEQWFEIIRKYIITDRICNTLPPDMVILDEFQNYARLLYDDIDGHELFIKMLNKASYTLMLSATPYEMPADDVRKMNSQPYKDDTGLAAKNNDNAEESEDNTLAEAAAKNPNEEFEKLVKFIYNKNLNGIKLDDENFLYDNILCRSERAMFYPNQNKNDEVTELYITPGEAVKHTDYTKKLYQHYKNSCPEWKLTEEINKFIALVKECPSFAKFCTRYTSIKGNDKNKNEHTFYYNHSGLFKESLSPEEHSGISLLKKMAYQSDSLSLMLWIPPAISTNIPADYRNCNNPFWTNRNYSKTLVFGNYRMSTACSAYYFSKINRERQKELEKLKGDISGTPEEIDINPYLPEANGNQAYNAAREALAKVIRQYLYHYRHVICYAAETSDLKKAVKIYAAMGGLKSVLEEYSLLIGLKEDANDNKLKELKNKFERMYACLTGEKTGNIQLSPTRVICYDKYISDISDSSRLKEKFSYSCGFAERFTDDDSDQGAHRDTHQKNLQFMFNSPFYPFIISTTSVAQEGLDFHNYCHQILHWSIPRTPAAYEQREGRIDRYLSHLVRKRLVQKYNNINSWKDILAKAEQEKSSEKPLFPYWYVEMTQDMPEFIRGINVLPNSRESDYFAKLKNALAEYNYYLGPNYQEKPAINLCPLTKNKPEKVC